MLCWYFITVIGCRLYDIFNKIIFIEVINVMTTTRDLPAWQSKLISQIVFCLKQNYISFEEEFSESKLTGDLSERFSNEFS